MKDDIKFTKTPINKKEPKTPCRNCGFKVWYQSVYGEWLCDCCKPNPEIKEVKE